MDKFYISNTSNSLAGLAIKAGGSALVKYTNTLTGKAGGLVATPKTTADCPSLSTSLFYGAPKVGGTFPAVTNIPTLKARYFTLVGIIDPVTTALTVRWQHGVDFSEVTDIGRTQYINGFLNNNEFIIGLVCIINGTASDFIPGTTALDVALSSVVYQDSFGIIGA